MKLWIVLGSVLGWMIILGGIITIASAYTPPASYSSVNFTLLENDTYTPPTYTSVNFTLGEVTAADSCTYSSGNWIVDCAHGCNITSAVDLGGDNITITGTGFFGTTSNITNVGTLTIKGNSSSNRCVVTCSGGGCFR